MKLNNNNGCNIPGCHREHYAKGLCVIHYEQKRHNRPITLRSKHDRNEIVDCGSYSEIVLYDKNKQEKARTKIDNEDVEKIKNRKWYLSSTGYVMSDTEKKATLLHRYITNAGKGYVVDHINHDTLDNRKNNLRVCTQSENIQNSIRNIKSNTGHIGVTKVKKWWTAQICVNGKHLYLGIYKTLYDAINARKQAEEEHLGEYVPRYK
jgi:hypothetical protein